MLQKIKSLEVEHYRVATWVDKDGALGRFLQLIGKKVKGGPVPQIDIHFQRRTRTLRVPAEQLSSPSYLGSREAQQVVLAGLSESSSLPPPHGR